jgi:acetyl esterase/lipase
MSSTRAPSEKWTGVDEKDIKITVRDGFENRARVYSPSGASTEGNPLLVMVFGGGWVLGKLEQEETNCRSWVKNYGGVAIAVEHR